MASAPIDLRVTMPVTHEDPPRLSYPDGKTFRPGRVVFGVHWYSDNAVLASATAYAADGGGNYSLALWSPGRDVTPTFPEWCPEPPEWFEAAVSAMVQEVSA